MPIETLKQQLDRILGTMRAAGKRPVRIYMTWGQLAQLRTECNINPARLEFRGIPIQLDPAARGLWVSSLTNDGEGG